MKMCEKMAAIVTDSSLLKSNDVRLKDETFWAKVCCSCDLGINENSKHVIMQCPFYENTKQVMFNEIEQMQCEEVKPALMNAAEMLPILLGKQPENVSIENMISLCIITGMYITGIYDNVIIR